MRLLVKFKYGIIDRIFLIKTATSTASKPWQHYKDKNTKQH